MPVFDFKSNAKPSLFAYPPKITPPTTAAPTKVSTAVLSTTKKKELRDKKKGDAMEVEKVEPKKEEPKKEDKVEEKKEPEPEFEMKSNPARVTLAQVKYLSFHTEERYKPIREGDAFGIVMLKDLKPELPERLVSPTTAAGGKAVEEEEPSPPEPFEYDPQKG